MKTPKDNNPLRVTLKCFTLAVTAGVGLGVGNAQAAPANDNFADAIELVGDSGTQTGTDNVDATFEVDEPVCLFADTTKTVWFKWVCAEAGSLTLDTTGSLTAIPAEWDAVLGVYTGPSLAALTAVPGTPQDNGVAEDKSFTVAPGTYFIQLGGYAPPVGGDVATNILLTWSFTAAGGVVDISGEINIDGAVGAGTSGRLIGNTTTFWNSQGFTVPLDINGFTLTVDSGGGNEPFGAHGSISGAAPVSGHSVIFDTTFDHKITVDAVNSYSGSTFVRRGWIQLANPAGQTALLGAITVGGTDKAKLVWSASDQIDDASNITLVTIDSRLDLAGHSETINDLYLVTGTAVETGVGGVLKVARLFLNGVEQDEVAKIAGDGFVLGSGYIEVGASGPPVIETAPAEPATPTPTDGLATVHPALLATLNWGDCAGATSYDVYLVLASDPDPELGVTTPTANVALSEYTLGSQVLSLTNYKWQVVAKNVVGDTAGPVWTFSTVDRTQVAGNFSSGYSDGTHNLNFIVGVGNSATLLGNFRVHWSGGQGSFSVPVDNNGFILDADTGGGNGGHNASGAISGGGSYIITHGPAGGAWDNIYTISGATANSYTGGTVIKRGTVLMNKTAGVDALPPTAITLGSTGESARLIWGADNQVNDLANIEVLLPTVTVVPVDANMNYLDLAGHSDTIASLTLPDDGTKTQVRTGAGGVLTVTTLMVNGVPKGPGTYDFNDGFITGSGSVVVAGAGVTFASWAASKGLVEGDAAFDADPDGDGIDNSIEFVIGGEPNPANPGSNSCALLPTVEAQGDDLVITFTLMDDAAYLDPVIEFDANLEGEWTTAVDPDNATIEITPGSPADTITVTIPKGANTELFARLKVVEP